MVNTASRTSSERVLTTLRRLKNPITRQQIVAKTGLTPDAAKGALQTLIATGTVVVAGEKYTGARPAKLYRVA